MRLIGTETSYDLRREAFDEKIRQMPEPLWSKDIFPDSPDTGNYEDLPFSETVIYGEADDYMEIIIWLIVMIPVSALFSGIVPSVGCLGGIPVLIMIFL